MDFQVASLKMTKESQVYLAFLFQTLSEEKHPVRKKCEVQGKG